MPSNQYEFVSPNDPRIAEMARQVAQLRDYLDGMQRVRGRHSDDGVTLSAVGRTFVTMGMQYGLDLADLLTGIEEIYADVLYEKGKL